MEEEKDTSEESSPNSDSEVSDGLVAQESEDELSSDNESDTSEPVRKKREQGAAPAASPPVAVLAGRNGFQWRRTPPVAHLILGHDIVTDRPGLPLYARGCQTVSDSFRKLFTPAICDHIIRCTNVRAEAYVAAANSRRGNRSQLLWKVLDETEFNAFVGLLILLGVWLSNHESLTEAWSPSHGRPILRAVMGQNRFRDILRHCRFDDMCTRDVRRATDKLASIRHVWELLLHQLSIMYRPSPMLTVDEQLLGTRGRCPFKQYIPSKPGRYGIKIFWIADATNSYPLRGEIYVGQQPQETTIESRARNTAAQLVKRLACGWLDRGRNITMDNYFTSVPLAIDLLARRTTILGTLRKNKAEVPKEMLASRQRNQNSAIFGFANHLTLVSYVPKVNRCVLLLSSMHHNDEVCCAENSHKPQAILDYNRTKCGVDNIDRLIRAASVKRKIRRWPMTLFFNMIDIAALAALILLKLDHPDWLRGRLDSRRLFLKELGLQLVDQCIRRRLVNPRTIPRGVRFSLQTLGYLTIPDRDHEPQPSKKRCYLCPRSLDRKTTCVCTTCKQHICPDHKVSVCEDCLME